MTTQPYKLSCSIYGHKGDVRSVAATRDGKIVSGSRDMTAKLWTPNDSGCGYREHISLVAHENFVSCVCALPPSSNYRNGLILTGSNDKLIRMYDANQCDPIKVLNGHLNTVCKIVPGAKDGCVLSSSWDQTAKLWDLASFKTLAEYSGHNGAVWSVLQLPCEIVVTASADKKIKIWMNSGICINTLHGHTDCIRDLAMSAPKEILSCSNDATIRQWNVESGQCLNTFYGHSHFVYSIFYLDSLRFLTSSEDHTVKLWTNGKVVETIQIPALSVWSVAALPNGDIVTGSSDGVIRVFSTNSMRQANAEELKAYEEQILIMSQKHSQKIGSLDVSELSGEESLLEKGITDGQTKIIKVGSDVLAYSWSSAECKWDLIGHVTGSAEDAEEKPKYRGKSYDYVFSVDIETGKPLLKLPYNKSDDPWQAAQKFIHDNQLSQHFLEEVANFIMKNSNHEDNKNAQEFKDPFTGETRYIPGKSPNSDCTSAATGSKCQNSTNSLLQGSFFPQKEFLRFDHANLNLILEKILEFHAKGGNGREHLSTSRIESLVKTCEPGSRFETENVETLNALLTWSEDMVFPALDVMRLSIRNAAANNLLCNDKLLPKLMVYLSPVPGGDAKNTMLALRVLVNMISGEAGMNVAYKNKFDLFKIITNVSSHPGKPVQIAAGTLLLNLCVLLRRKETLDGREEALSVGHHALLSFTDQEALFRVLVAIGTLLVDTIDTEKYRSTFEKILLKHQSDSSSEFKIQQCCQQLLRLLH